MQVQGHKVLITGGASGIGLALARQFHRHGNQVVIVGRNQVALDAAAASMPGSLARAADITQAEHRQRLVNEFSDVSVLVNNAGIQRNGTLAAASASDIASEIDINFTAPQLLTHGFLPQLQQRREAAIVNVTSVLALVPKQSASIYCASKAGLRSFTRSLRWQLEDGPVRVFELVPPLVETPMTAGRGTGKMTPEALAETFWTGFANNRYEILAGKARAAAMLARWVPGLAERIIRRGA